jgi:hypothetical protein
MRVKVPPLAAAPARATGLSLVLSPRGIHDATPPPASRNSMP